MVVLSATPASAHGIGLGVHPFQVGIGMPRAAIAPGVRPGVFPNVRPGIRPGVRPAVYPGVRPGVRSGVRPGVVRDGRLRGGRGGYGDYGLDEVGPGLSLVGDLAAPPYPGGYGYGGYGPPPPYDPASAPPTCIRPLIIAVGKGLRRAVRTHVVYGMPPSCR